MIAKQPTKHAVTQLVFPMALACLFATKVAAQSEVEAPVASANRSLKADVVEVLSAQTDAWNAGDIDRFMETYWNSDELTFSSGGELKRGWKTTRENYHRRYPNRAAMGELRFDQIEVRGLGSSAALVLGRWHLRRQESPLEGNFTLVLRKIDDAWKIVHDHTSLLRSR